LAARWVSDRAQKVMKFLEARVNLRMVDWPHCSSDLSPIENIWGQLKEQVSKDMPKTAEQPKISLKSYWKKLNLEFLAPHIDSMEYGIKEVIKNKVNRVRY